MPHRIIEYLAAIPAAVHQMNVRSLLTNGKIEAQLKTLLGIGWVAQGANRSYLMDKRLRAPLDLVGFEDGQPRFWVETKCDFGADRPRVERSARTALTQVLRYRRTLLPELQRSRIYIVHFLCSLPHPQEYPDWVRTFNHLRNERDPYDGAGLKDYYTLQLKRRRLERPSQTYTLGLGESGRVGVVIVRVDNNLE